jgi:hypothetical protein
MSALPLATMYKMLPQAPQGLNQHTMSSSLKVILFKGKILNNGEHPILIRVIKDRKSSYLSIGASSSLKNWDVRSGLPKKSHPDFKELLLLIDIKRAEASSLIFGIKTASTEVSAHEIIGDQTLADAILDRIVHDAQRIELQGDSLRKKRKLEDQKV